MMKAIRKMIPEKYQQMIQKRIDELHESEALATEKVLARVAQKQRLGEAPSWWY